MVYDAASRRAAAERGGLEGGEGIPELTSGTPLDPAHQRSAVVEAAERRGGGAQGVAARADGAGRRGVRVR
jgi:hypothetical protein